MEKCQTWGKDVTVQQQCLGSCRFCYRNKSDDFSMVKNLTLEKSSGTTAVSLTSLH